MGVDCGFDLWFPEATTEGATTEGSGWYFLCSGEGDANSFTAGLEQTHEMEQMREMEETREMEQYIKWTTYMTWKIWTT